MKPPKANLPASIHRRLLDGARQRGEDFQLTLLRYAAERLLYRMGRSPHARDFVLKGAMLFLLWPDQLYRPTRDVDLLGFGEPAPERLRRIFVEIGAQQFPEDALQFDSASVTADPIRTIQDYGGVRVTMVASLGKARIPLQIDIGFGDAITPAPRDATFPTLLPLDAPRVRAYPLETVVAEKFDAAVRLGRTNSRMKDFHDLCILAARCEFDGALLTQAVRATFTRRKADLTLVPDVLAPAFYADLALGQRWRAFAKGLPIASQVGMTFVDVGGKPVPRTIGRRRVRQHRIGPMERDNGLDVGAAVASMGPPAPICTALEHAQARRSARKVPSAPPSRSAQPRWQRLFQRAVRARMCGGFRRAAALPWIVASHPLPAASSSDTIPPASWRKPMPHVVALVLLFLVGPVLGQGWVDRTGPNGPAPRYGHAMCYDPGHGYTLMVGSYFPPGASSPISDTWSWDGTAWTNRGWAPSNMRSLVWHAATSQLVGMATGSGSPTFTLHLWTGTTWTLLDSMTSSGWSGSGPVHASGAYDSVRQETVFRPSSDYGAGPASVYAYNGSLLQQRFTTSGPDHSRGYIPYIGFGHESMAWDPLSQKILLARDDSYWSLLGSTWVQIAVVRFYEWSGFGWNIRYPATAPGRCGPMATDTSHQRVLMLDAESPGMQSPGANQPNHTWSIGNGDCTNLTTSICPIPRSQSAMAFDPTRGVCVLFGGLPWQSANLADTWEFDLGPLASFTPYGTGCVGSRGVPSITAQGTSTPRLGTTFTAQINGLPWTGPAFLFVGLSDTNYGGTPLPFNLNVLGAPGCNLLTSCEQIHLLTNVLGSAQWSFPVPPVPGASFYTQVFPLDPVNALGLTASNGGRGVIGL